MEESFWRSRRSDQPIGPRGGPRPSRRLTGIRSRPFKLDDRAIGHAQVLLCGLLQKPGSDGTNVLLEPIDPRGIIVEQGEAREKVGAAWRQKPIV